MQGECAKGLFPALDDRSLDESGGGSALGGGRPFSLVRARVRLSSMSRMASQS